MYNYTSQISRKKLYHLVANLWMADHQQIQAAVFWVAHEEWLLLVRSCASVHPLFLLSSWVALAGVYICQAVAWTLRHAVVWLVSAVVWLVSGCIDLSAQMTQLVLSQRVASRIPYLSSSSSLLPAGGHHMWAAVGIHALV